MLSSVEKSKKNPTKHGPQSQIVHKKVPVSKKAGKEKYKTPKFCSVLEGAVEKIGSRVRRVGELKDRRML